MNYSLFCEEIVTNWKYKYSTIAPKRNEAIFLASLINLFSLTTISQPTAAVAAVELSRNSHTIDNN